MSEATTVGVSVTVDGTKYVLDLDHIEAGVVRRVRRELGYSVRSLLELGFSDPDIDVMAQIIWVSRLAAGEDVDLETVETALDYSVELEFDELGEDDVPEADPEI